MLSEMPDVLFCDEIPFGEGAFSKVMRVRIPGDPRIYALKIVFLSGRKIEAFKVRQGEFGKGNRNTLQS